MRHVDYFTDSHGRRLPWKVTESVALLDLQSESGSSTAGVGSFTVPSSLLRVTWHIAMKSLDTEPEPVPEDITGCTANVYPRTRIGGPGTKALRGRRVLSTGAIPYGEEVSSHADLFVVETTITATATLGQGQMMLVVDWELPGDIPAELREEILSRCSVNGPNTTPVL